VAYIFALFFSQLSQFPNSWLIRCCKKDVANNPVFTHS